MAQTLVIGSIIGGAICLTGVSAYAIINTAVGSCSQPGDHSQLSSGAVTSSSNCISSLLSSLNPRVSSKGIFTDAFKNNNEYVKFVKRFIEDYHDVNQEFGILRKEMEEVGDGKGFDVPIMIDVFWAYGVPGHENVHTSLLFAYKGTMEGKFVLFKTDLQAGVNDVSVFNEEKQDNVIMHEIKVCSGIDETTWRNYAGTINISLIELFRIIKKGMITFPKYYNGLNANCIQFKNVLIEDLRKFFHAKNKRVTKVAKNRRRNCTQTNIEELSLAVPKTFGRNDYVNTHIDSD